MLKNKSKFSLENLYQAIINLTTQRRFLIAYSGGLDSHVLLHSMVMLRKNYSNLQLRAVHINHNLSPNAKSWEDHCRNICNALQIGFFVKRIQISRGKKESLEAIARDLRYQEIAKLLTDNECLLTAHTQDDQAETLLLQLFRGAGLKGLASMPEKTEFANGWHLRPLLSFNREQLATYAKKNNLQWIEDESNYNLDFSRNYLRHKLIPLIKERWPAIATTLARSANHIAAADKLLNELAVKKLKKMQGTIPGTLSNKKLLTINDEQQENVLRTWIQQQNFTLPSTVKIQQIQKEVLLARIDANPIVKWRNCEVRRYQDNLYIMPPVSIKNVKWENIWNTLHPLQLPGNLGLLTANKKFVENVTVRFRKNGERCYPTGRIGSHPLKKLFQEWQVPTWERDRIPLIFYKEKLIAVPGYFGKEFKIER